ncbi:MAG: uroporphyrinogen decarboxylase [Acidobacteria bacterium]|nr:uroporphyrinogen decarboxylase [Acidobacteriota bacterium]
MNDLLLRTLRGQDTERRPLWIMRQAGRYLPEYRALRERFSFEELCARPDLATEVTLMPLERFPLDAAIVFADIMSPIGALGIDVEFAPGPVINKPLRSAAAIQALPVPDQEEIAPTVLETIRSVKNELADRVPVLGFSGGPWTLAAYLVQGRGGRDFPALRALAADEPGVLADLLERLTDLSVSYLRGQVEAGVDAVQIFETWSGVLSFADWSALVKPHLQNLLEQIGELGVPSILFMQNAPHLLGGMISLPADGFSVDWRVDLSGLRQALGPQKVLQGNLDPAVLLAGPERTSRAARRLLQGVPREGHIVNLGHGILPQTPIESVEALIEAVHDEAQEDRRAVASAGTGG